MVGLHELGEVMGVGLPLVQLEKFAPHLLELVPHARVVGQTQEGVVLVHWRSVADAVLEPFCIPVHELQLLFLTQLLDVSVDLGKGHLAPQDQAHREVGPLRGTGLDELVFVVIDVMEDFIEPSWLEPGIGDVVERGYRGQQKMDVRVWHQVHRDLVEVHIQDALESHGAGQVR